MSFESTTVVITGGGSGIGAKTAEAFGAAGASVVIADVNVENARKVAASILKSSPEVMSVKLNVSDPQSVEAAFSAGEDWKGRPTAVLVNSVGIIGISSLLDYKLEDWQKVLSINVTGTFLCAQRAARSMATARYGRIINLASSSAERVGVGRVAYGTSKAAVVGLTRQSTNTLMETPPPRAE